MMVARQRSMVLSAWQHNAIWSVPPSRSSRVGFTLIELLVVIAIIAILAAILFPVFSQVREKARATSCLSNTKQLGLALTQYYQDWDERLVLNGIALGYQYGQWADFLQPYIKNDQLLICPSSQRNSSRPYNRWITGQGRQCAYTVNNVYWNNANLGRLFEQGGGLGPTSIAQVEDPVGTVFCTDGGDAETTGSSNGTQCVDLSARPIEVRTDKSQVPLGYPAILSNQGDLIARHIEGMNVIFLDGHAKWLKVDEIGKAKPKPPNDPRYSSTYASLGRGIYYPYFTKLLD